MLYDFFNREGKGIGRGEGENPIKAAMNGGVKEYFKAEEVVAQDPEEVTTNNPVNSMSEPSKSEGKVPGGKKSRKPRADTGKPRAKKVAPEKGKRVRDGQYFVFSASPLFIGTKDGVFQFAEKCPADAQTCVVRGRRLVIDRKVQFTLKPAK